MMPGSTCGKTNESTVKTKENRVFVDGYLGTSNHRMFFIYGIDPNIAITFPIYILYSICLLIVKHCPFI